MKKRDSISYRLTMMFIIFLIVCVAFCGAALYYAQMRIYRAQTIESLENVNRELVELMQNDGQDFINYQKLAIEHYMDIDIPIDVSDYTVYQHEYEALLAERHPGKTLNVDISIDELDPDVQLAFLKYKQVYWILSFESARKAFGLPYTYYLLMYPETSSVVYLIDGERQSRKGHYDFLEAYPDYPAIDHPQGNEAVYMYLFDEYENFPENQPVEWRTWEAGEAINDFQIWHNQWGDTYSYYLPLIINGEKLGLVASEIEIAKVNGIIIRNTLLPIAGIAVILAGASAILIRRIKRKYISKLVSLETHVREYTETKDPGVAAEIIGDIKYHNEISSLAEGISGMILEIEEYVNNLVETNRALLAAEDNAARMKNLANQDALTGVRNRTAYENEMRNLDQEVDGGNAQFALAMIDLNYLKLINDKYGHDKGNIAIQTLSKVICDVFKHSKVFRIGGDEFVAVMKNEDYNQRDLLYMEFNERMHQLSGNAELHPWERVTAAIGIAAYDEKMDVSTKTVFRRADNNMYQFKKRMHATRPQDDIII